MVIKTANDGATRMAAFPVPTLIIHPWGRRHRLSYDAGGLLRRTNAAHSVLKGNHTAGASQPARNSEGTAAGVAWFLTVSQWRAIIFHWDFTSQEAGLPLYEYECKKCHRRMEKIRKFSDPPLTKCESCGGKLEQLISSPSIRFKGSGWYVNDYAKKSTPPESSSDGDSSPSTEKKDTSAGKEKAAEKGKEKGAEKGKESSKSSEPAKTSPSKVKE
jgi:putative FmdB family regulatory protein